MSSPLRTFQEGYFYHIYNRGNRKQQIFFSSADYMRFLEKLTLYKKKYPVTIAAYCLMPNHYHLLIRQNSATPLTSLMLRLGTSYSKYFNIKYKQVGSLFQGRFQAKPVNSDIYLLHLSRYIHRNPTPTPGVGLDQYEWSSYKIYLQAKATSLVDPSYILKYFAKTTDKQSAEYKKFVEYDFMLTPGVEV